jgi:LysM repeat protein
MARIEKTVFISYRRKDISWALAVYQYLTSRKYDVFFDFSSLSSGDFEEVIVSNIRARAHFVLILTPTALDRCNEPGDWLRREIETAIEEKRNILPLFFDGFNFGSQTVAEKLTGKLATLNHYNGLDIPSGYFMEAMERLRGRYLNVPLNAVIQPISTEVQKVVKDEQVAANKALIQKSEDIKELVKPAEENRANSSSPRERGVRGEGKVPYLRLYGIGVGILLIAALGIFGINSLIGNNNESSTPTLTYPAPLPTITVVPSEISLTTVTMGDSGASIPTEISVTMINYTVQTGDTCVTITTKYKVSIPSIILANDLSTNCIITVGQVLKIPVPVLSTVVAAATLGIGSNMVSPKDGMTLLYVPAGEFTMGNDNGDANEKPAHKVTLDAFWIDQTEVTNVMYRKCVLGGACNEPLNTISYADSNYASHPVVYVTWEDASPMGKSRQLG